MEEELIKEVCYKIRKHFERSLHHSYNDVMCLSLALAAGYLEGKDSCDYIKVYNAISKEVCKIVLDE
jgi:hypothetical protein